MLQYETYTVFLRGFELVGSESGLSFTNAFHRVLGHAGKPCMFEERDGAVALVFQDTAIEPIVSRSPIESDAKREVMLAAVDGRFGFAALCDAAFVRLNLASTRDPMILDANASRFLLHAAITDRAHRFPGVKLPQGGHAKAGFDMGLTSFSRDVAGRIAELGIVWTRPERP